MTPPRRGKLPPTVWPETIAALKKAKVLAYFAEEVTMIDFDTKKFLDLLVDACADVEAKDEPFKADPSLLGPRLLSASKSFSTQEMHLNALLENRWVVSQSPEDGLWRVSSADTGKFAGGQEKGSHGRLNALDAAIIAKCMKIT